MSISTHNFRKLHEGRLYKDQGLGGLLPAYDRTQFRGSTAGNDSLQTEIIGMLEDYESSLSSLPTLLMDSLGYVVWVKPNAPSSIPLPSSMQKGQDPEYFFERYSTKSQRSNLIQRLSADKNVVFIERIIDYEFLKERKPYLFDEQKQIS